MTKRVTAWALIFAVAVAVAAGCGKGEGGGTPGERIAKQPAGVEDVLQAGMEEGDKRNVDSETAPPKGMNQDASEPQEKEKDIEQRSTEGIDIDLTSLSSTMVYSEVYNMMNSPDDYLGKTVKMGGLFAVYYAEDLDTYYFACIIQDAAACCAQGVEFVLTDDYSYPEDYPEEGGEITVIGVFDTYLENGQEYCTLRNARLL